MKILEWFTEYPLTYTVLSACAACGVVVIALYPLLRQRGGAQAPRSDESRPLLFCLIVAAAFLVVQWPAYFAETEINVDETMMIVEAEKLASDLVFWRSADGTTHGPLNVYPLTLIRLIGWEFSYGAARFLGGLMLISALLAQYFTVRRFLPEGAARLSLLPPWFFWAFTIDHNFVLYSSEHVSILLLSTGIWALLRPSEPATPATIRPNWIFGGILLGAVPWAKLQAAPVAASLLLLFSIFEFTRLGPRNPAAWTKVLVLALSSLVATFGFATMTFAAGILPYAWAAYFEHNIAYKNASSASFADMLKDFWGLTHLALGYRAYLASSALFAIGLLARRPRNLSSFLPLLVTGCVFCLTSLYAVLAPGRSAPHYLAFLIMPISLLSSVGLGFVLGQDASPRGRHRAFTAIGMAVLAMALQALPRARHAHPYLPNLIHYQQHRLSSVSQTVLTFASPGEFMGLWGWEQKHYLETHLLMATRESHSERQIITSYPLCEYFRETYLVEFKRTLPPVFLDTVGPGKFMFEDRATQGHEIFPALAQLIADNYRMVDDLEGVRIYVRNDRVLSATSPVGPEATDTAPAP